MQNKKIHIICFDNPEPPIYGGVIDVFYRIKALYNQGIKITLHIWEYNQKTKIEKLQQWCEKVYFYPRRMSLSTHLSIKPYIVQSRISDSLIENLLKDNNPILFEGIHSCGQLNDTRLAMRKKIVRIHNIEHFYYHHLFSNEKNILKKTFFLIESLKLRLFEKQLKHASYLLAISKNDFTYLENKFPYQETILLSGFHPNEQMSSPLGRGKYILYHGNLEVSENNKAALFLIENVFSKIPIPVIIAGRNPKPTLYEASKDHKNIKVVANPSQEEMENLAKNTQLHLLYTFQDTGLKLKLLNTLYQGRHLLVNKKMLAGTDLDRACHIADDPKTLILKVKELYNIDFTIEDIKKREVILGKRYSNSFNILNFIKLL
jgi:hypothetical protein